MMGAKFKKSLLGCLFLGLALTLITTSPALATSKQWVGGNGDWNVDTNWDFPGVPIAGDDVLLTYDLQGSITINYLNTVNPLLNSMLLDGQEFFTTMVIQDQDTLSVKNTEIGKNGWGTYIQGGGSHKITQDLSLGVTPSGFGTYNLNGGSLYVGGTEKLGVTGGGDFLLGEGDFNQTGGTHTIGGNLYLAFDEGSLGYYSLKPPLQSALNNGLSCSKDFSLTVNGAAWVGHRGTYGEFNQWTGTVTLKGQNQEALKLQTSAPTPGLKKTNELQCGTSQGVGLIVGNETEGVYNLQDGDLSVSFGEVIGWKATSDGRFNQDGGTHKLSGPLYLAKDALSYAEYNLGAGLFTVSGYATVGGEGEAYFTQTGGDVFIKGKNPNVSLSLGKTPLSKSSAPNLECHQQGQYIGLIIGQGKGSAGYYSLGGDGDLAVSYGEVVGMQSEATGWFGQFGGTHTVGGNLTIAQASGSIGSYILGNPLGLTPGGTRLKVQGSLLNNEGGTFDFYGGELLANVINKGIFNAYGPGTRTFPKQFFNYGTFNIKGNPLGTAAFAQKFRNYGIYQSTEANSEFTYLFVAPEGYLVAGAGDIYSVMKEFTNTSTQNTVEGKKWVTDAAHLVFTGPGRKPLKTGSADNGPTGFTDNFAWGSLEIKEGSVRLLDHLYAFNILGIKVNSQNNKITNLYGTCGSGIYYYDIDLDFSTVEKYILTNIYHKQVGFFTSEGYVPECK